MRPRPALKFFGEQLRGLWRDALDFCYPAGCIACGDPCDAEGQFCSACDEGLKRLQALPACERCALPLATAGAPCPHCRGKGLPRYRHVARLGPLEEPLRGLIHQMKYHKRWSVAEHLADLLLENSGAQRLLLSADVIVPVPLHRFRQIGRGFNQAELIARRLAAWRGTPLARPVVRSRRTETQTHFYSRSRRMKNLRGAFQLTHPESVRGKHVVIVDDVMTSGATLQSMARTLNPARAASLSAIVIAVADPHGLGLGVM